MSTKEQRRKLASQKKHKKSQEIRAANYPRPKYSVGNLIQVNDDIMDYDWDDLPLGGWVGKITEIHREQDGPKYDVDWSDETVAKCHPIYEKLAEREGWVFGKYTKLAEKEIHAFTTGEVVLVDPGDVSRYTDRPLDPEDHTDRIRMIFGTKPLEWFPMLDDNEESNTRLLKQYYDYLSEHLPLPFEATYVQRNRGRLVSKQAFVVKALINPDIVKAENRDDGCIGLCCTGLDATGNLLEVPLQQIDCENMPHKQLLDDYRSWLGDLSSLFDTFDALWGNG